MDKILAIMPKSIGGRLTTSSFIDGFIQNGFKAVIFDELKNDDIKKYQNDDYKYIIGYDFSPVKIKIDNDLKMPLISYFSDDIHQKTAGEGYLEYYKYLKNSDIFVFYWDRKLAKKEKLNYMPHFVNSEIYKNFKKPIADVSFMGRFDTSLRLNIFLKLNKRLPDLTFKWYAIERHYKDALLRCRDVEDKNIIKNAYCGFIDNEKNMAEAINETKIVYNINSQGITSLNYRTMQVLACERLIISDEREELDLFDNIIPTYANIDDLENKIRYYLKNKDEYSKITKKSREIIKLNHDSKICVRNMLHKIK